MKKVLVSSFICIALLSGCGSAGQDQDTTVNQESSFQSVNDADSNNGNAGDGVVTPEEFNQIFSDPDKFKGKRVEFFAQVFTEPEVDSDGVYLQVYADPVDRELNAIVFYLKPDFKVESDDFIKVEGVVRGEFEGENMMGGTIVAPTIEATKIDISDYVTAVSPSLSTIEINQEIDQQGFKVLLEKVEFAENETRMYLKVTNNTGDSINLYEFNSKIVQNSTQYETTDNYDADYKEIQSDILPEVSSDGIFLFEKIDPASGDIKLILEGSSDDWDLDLVPFEFVISSK